jgi:hypothetical protein
LLFFIKKKQRNDVETLSRVSIETFNLFAVPDAVFCCLLNALFEKF